MRAAWPEHIDGDPKTWSDAVSPNTMLAVDSVDNPVPFFYVAGVFETYTVEETEAAPFNSTGQSCRRPGEGHQQQCSAAQPVSDQAEHDQHQPVLSARGATTYTPPPTERREN
jgi:hypothetical protein